MERCTVSREKRYSAAAGPSSSFVDPDASEASSLRDSDEYTCSLCYGNRFDLSGLIKHVHDEHAYQQRLARCPVCSRAVKDLLSHLLIHQRNAEDRVCSSSSPSSQASSSLSSAMSSDWARATKQEEDMLLKLKASSLSGTPCLHRQESLTDKHGRLKQSNGQASQHSLQLESRDDVARQQQTVDAPVRPAVVDTPELRSQYVRELLLSAFELGAGFS